ncbi:MAG TPA: hypothetical protein VFY14_20885 [Streptomyces sp.]|nr:hypothetical protein [Streptomyces sp.]
MPTGADAVPERAAFRGPPRPDPQPGASGGGRGCAWVVGDCWLWCRRTGTAVTWLGPVISWGTHAPLYACEDCISRLEEQVRTSPAHQDASCWLWCRRGGVPVTPLAEVECRGRTTVFYACEDCIGLLKHRVLSTVMVRDTARRRPGP